MRFLREPLVQFVVVGALLFLLHGLTGRDEVVRDTRIVVGQGERNRLAAQWELQWGRAPTEVEMEHLVDELIREEMLYREALALGLDQDDTIVRRRLAQKVEFLTRDLALAAEPSQEELEQFLGRHSAEFEQPAQFSFTHVYFRSGGSAGPDETRVLAALESLRSEPPADPETLGDRCMLPNRLQNQTRAQVLQSFGSRFADQLVHLPAGPWSGPILSGFGTHLVRIEAVVEARVPELDEIHEQVLAAWREERRRLADEAFLAELRERYEVVVETDSGSP